MLDNKKVMLYYKHKLVRFTGVPLIYLVECGDSLKQKQRIKTNQCAPRVGAHQREREESCKVASLFLMV